MNILATITKEVGDHPQGGDMYYLVDCGSTCQGIQITLTSTSGDSDLFGKVGGRPDKTGSTTCSNCDCTSMLVHFVFNDNYKF